MSFLKSRGKKLEVHCVFSKKYKHNGKSNGKYDVASSQSIQFREKVFVFLVRYVSAKIIPVQRLSHEIRKMLPLLKVNECPLSCKLFVFFYLGFLSQTFMIRSTAGEGRGYFVTPLYFSHPFHSHLDINRLTNGEHSPLYITRTENLWFSTKQSALKNY